MPADFHDAAVRHWQDAGLLMADSRIPNSDHLFGLAAECGLKAVMQGLGMTLDLHEKPTDAKYRQHINRLWDEFITFAQTQNGAQYAFAIDVMPNPFHNWDVNQRYWHGSHITQAAAENHRQGAQKAMDVLRDAVLDGVI